MEKLLQQQEKGQIGFSDDFSYGGNSIRYEITKDNRVQLYVEDCAKALGVVQIKKLKDDTMSTSIRWERVYGDLVGIDKIPNAGDFSKMDNSMKKHMRDQMKNMTISESELYLWSFRVDNEQGKKFREWLAKIVLPNLREHGIYVTGMENMTPEQVKRVTDERIESFILRKFGIGVRKELTDTIKKVINPAPYEGYKYGVYTNIVYKTLFGMDCKKYKEFRGIDEKDNLRDFLANNNEDNNINNITKAEDFMGSLIMAGITDELMLENLLNNWYKTLIA